MHAMDMLSSCPYLENMIYLWACLVCVPICNSRINRNIFTSLLDSKAWFPHSHWQSATARITAAAAQSRHEVYLSQAAVASLRHLQSFGSASPQYAAALSAASAAAASAELYGNQALQSTKNRKNYANTKISRLALLSERLSYFMK